MPKIDTKDILSQFKDITLDSICTFKCRTFYRKCQSFLGPTAITPVVAHCYGTPEGLSCCDVKLPPDGVRIYYADNWSDWEWKVRLSTSMATVERSFRLDGPLPPSFWGDENFTESEDPVDPFFITNYRYRAFSYGKVSMFDVYGDSEYACNYYEFFNDMYVTYTKEREVQLIIDGAALAEAIVNNKPAASEGTEYVFSGFSFIKSVNIDITDDINNNLIVSIEGSNAEGLTLEDAFWAAYHSESTITATLKINPAIVNVANPDCNVHEYSLGGRTIKEVSYTGQLPDKIRLRYCLRDLTQQEKPFTCDKCQELKTITTETGETTQVCQPITCSSDSDCPSGCKCVDGKCQPEIICRSSKDCPEGQVCINGKCVDEKEKRKDSKNIGGLSGIGINSISYGDDSVDILYIPSNLPIYNAKGTQIGDAPYNQIDGIVVSTDGVFYYPHVRINRISDSFSEAGIMEFTQYAKFDDTPYFKEGQLIYGVLYGQVLFGGFINDISYTISEGEQLIKYTAISFRKNFEEAPWVFNYKDYNITTTEVLAKILSAAPRLYCRGSSGSLPKQTISEINLTNQTIGNGLSYLFSAAGTYAWHLGPDKIFRIYNLQNLPIEDIYVAQEGNNLSDHSEYKVISMDLNYNLSDRVTRLIIRGDFKRDRNNNIIEDFDGNPTYIVYDTGWRGTAYTQFNVQHTKTLIEDRFKYIEGMQDDTPYMKQYANLYLKPFQDAYIGGSIDLEGILTNFSIGKSVRIYNTNLSYLNDQILIIKDVEYDLDNKTTKLSLTGNYWFGTDITKFFATLEERINSIDNKIKALDYKEGELAVMTGQITIIHKHSLHFESNWMIKIKSASRILVVYPCRTCQFYNVSGISGLKVGDFIQVHYRRVTICGPGGINIYNRAYKIFKVTDI